MTFKLTASVTVVGLELPSPSLTSVPSPSLPPPTPASALPSSHLFISSHPFIHSLPSSFVCTCIQARTHAHTHVLTNTHVSSASLSFLALPLLPFPVFTVGVLGSSVVVRRHLWPLHIDSEDQTWSILLSRPQGNWRPGLMGGQKTGGRPEDEVGT